MKKHNVIVKKPFRDRYTGITRKEGDRLTISDDRYLEIRRLGDYVEIEKAPAKADKPEKSGAEIKK
jgi:hypothetical protein